MSFARYLFDQLFSLLIQLNSADIINLELMIAKRERLSIYHNYYEDDQVIILKT